MARKKLEIIEDVPETKTVEVIERHSYRKEVPIEPDVIVAPVDEEEPSDIFSTFNEIVSTNQTAVLRIWLLPKYDIDGRASIHATDREYCGSVPYHSDNAVLLDQISGRVPSGGMVQLELFADGAIRKRGLLKLVKQAAAANGQQGTHLVINQPAMPQQVAASPMAAMKEQAESFLAVANVIKQLQPEHVAPVQVDAPEPVSIKDKILEGVIMQAFSGPTVPADRFDRVLEVLGGGKPEASWIDSLMSGVAPHLGSILQQVGPGLNALFLRLATGAPVEAPPVPVQASSTGVLPDGQVGDGSAPDPAEYAWRRVLMRILDDCFEHVTATTQGRLGIDVHSSAEAIVDLGARFSENPVIVTTIEQLLTMVPESVIALCATMVPVPVQERVAALAQANTAIVWLGELQAETRAILAEGDNSENAETVGAGQPAEDQPA